MDETSFFTVDELAKHLRVHPITIRKYIKNGRINAFKVGYGKRSPWRIPKTVSNTLALTDLETIISQLIDKKMEK